MARFADADFFIKEDLQHKLEDFLPRLGTLTFQIKLGSMLDKTRRIEQLVYDLQSFVELDKEEAATAMRAAHLCKADLVSGVVCEFPESTRMQTAEIRSNSFFMKNQVKEKVLKSCHRDTKSQRITKVKSMMNCSL